MTPQPTGRPGRAIARTDTVEETLPCPKCGRFALVRRQMVRVHETGEAEVWGHVDRCGWCEPFESRMPTAQTFDQIRMAGAVV